VNWEGGGSVEPATFFSQTDRNVLLKSRLYPYSPHCIIILLSYVVVYLVDLIVSFLQRFLLLLVQFCDDGRDLRLVTQNDLALLCQVVVLSMYRLNDSPTRVKDTIPLETKNRSFQRRSSTELIS